MDADEVRALVAARWPAALRSPLAQAVQAACAADEASRAVQFAQLQADVTANDRRRLHADALSYALSCIDACQAQDIPFDQETLANNIGSGFPDLDEAACMDVAQQAMTRGGL